MTLFKRFVLITLVALFILSCATKNDKIENRTELPFEMVKLNNLDDFIITDHTNWLLAEDIVMDRNGSKTPEIVEGKGVLINGPVKDQPIQLSTTWQHSDLDLKIDFMLSKGSAAQLWLMNTYAIQIADSWEGDKTTSLHCGGILQQGGNEIIQPLLNACKAPGLWQHLYIKFKAPRFDTSGKKIKDALVESIQLNGVVIQDSTVLTKSTSTVPSNDNEKSGPLTLKVEKGVVAFRGISYKAYNEDRISLKDIKFEVFKGLYRKYDTLDTFTPVRTGVSDSLHWGVGDKRSQLVFKGTMHVPVKGRYLFKLRAGGSAWLIVDNKEVVSNNNTRDYTHAFFGTAELSEGDHDFKIVYANYDESLVVEYEGPSIPLTPLTRPSSQRQITPVKPLEYVVKAEPVLQRGFIMHQGEVNTYNMAVGLPGGLNYAYDLSTQSLLSVWRGKFIDVSNMWVERGEPQLEIPMGAPLELTGVPNVLYLEDKKDAWIDTVSVDNSIYIDRGYRITENGLPIFFYTYNKVMIEDHLYGRKDNAGFVRQVNVRFNEQSRDIYFLLGSGEAVQELPGKVYAIDDKAYFIESITGIDPNQVLIVKSKNGRQALLLLLAGKQGETISFNYSIIW